MVILTCAEFPISSDVSGKVYLYDVLNWIFKFSNGVKNYGGFDIILTMIYRGT